MRQLMSSGGTDYIAFAVTGICVLVISLIYVWYLERCQGKLSCPGLASKDDELGNLGEVSQEGGLHTFLTDQHRKLGPIFSFFWGKDIVVSVATPDLFQDVSVLFQRSCEQYELLKPIIDARSLQFLSSAEGQRHLNILDRHHGNIHKHFSGFVNIANQLVQKWANATNSEHIPLTQHLLAVSVKSALRITFGEAYFKTNGEILQVQEACHVCWEELEQRLHGDVAEPGSERQRTVDEKLQGLRAKVKDIIQHRKNNATKNSAPCLLDVLLEEEDVYPTEDCLVDILIVHVIGAFHTTGSLVAWAVYLLCLHPDVAEKLCSEVVQVVGDAELTFEHCKRLQFMQQVINETMRCSALVPLTVQSSLYDLMVGGHIIPKSTAIIQASGTVLQDTVLYPEPNKFNPDRFAQEEVRVRHPMSFQMFGFSGKPAVKYEAYALLLSIVRKFKLHLVEGQEMKFTHGLLTQFTNEVWVTAETR